MDSQYIFMELGNPFIVCFAAYALLVCGIYLTVKLVRELCDVFSTQNRWFRKYKRAAWMRKTDDDRLIEKEKADEAVLAKE